MSTLTQLRGGIALWVSGAIYQQYQVVRSPADRQLYLRITAAGSGATDPSADATNYAPEGARPIKSIQRGVITLANASASQAATITAVVTAKAELRLLGVTHSSADPIMGQAKIVLTNPTTITATRNGTTGDAVVSWELTERY